MCRLQIAESSADGLRLVGKLSDIYDEQVSYFRSYGLFLCDLHRRLQQKVTPLIVTATEVHTLLQ